jgi:peptide/nickel transport system permease protein
MDMLLPPDASHWLGTDDLGRDVLTRLLYGGPVAIYASLLATSLAILIGVPLGLIAGYMGGWVDAAVSRILDTILSFPAIILAVAVTGALGIGVTNSMIAMGIVLSPVCARLVRSQVLVLRNEIYVAASVGFGAHPMRILARHILPNAIQPVIVQSTLLLSAALLAEASLSFLGLGVQAPQPSWGGMLARAYTFMEIAPAQMYAPGMAILLTALAYNALGEELKRLLDPTLRFAGREADMANRQAASRQERTNDNGESIAPQLRQTGVE